MKLMLGRSSYFRRSYSLTYVKFSIVTPLKIVDDIFSCSENYTNLALFFFFFFFLQSYFHSNNKFLFLSRVQDLSQSTYRLFKVITLPSILPGLVHRWLCQKLIEYTPKYIISW